MRVFQSEENDRKFVQCDEDNFEASYAHGEWFDRKVVDITKMRELDIEEEFYEVTAILRQAKRALRWA